jgi:hypothetical protein
VVVAALAGQAGATAKSVTLIEIGGAGGDRFTDQLEESLSDLYQLVPGEVFQRTAEKLDSKGGTDGEVQAVATRLRIDAVIGGSIAVEGRAQKLVIVVRSGSSGRVIARGRYDLAGRAVPAICDRVLADLVRALDHINTAPAPVAKPRAPEPVKAVRYEETDDDDDSQPAAPAPRASRRTPAPAPAPADTED